MPFFPAGPGPVARPVLRHRGRADGGVRRVHRLRHQRRAAVERAPGDPRGQGRGGGQGQGLREKAWKKKKRRCYLRMFLIYI